MNLLHHFNDLWDSLQTSSFSESEVMTLTDSSEETPSALCQLEFALVETLSASVNEIHFSSTVKHTWEGLKQLALKLTGQLGYLMEDVSPLEHDEEMQTILIRSTDPEATGDGPRRYYEMKLFQTSAGTELSLERYESGKQQPKRSRIPMQLTKEVLVRLISNLETVFLAGVTG